MSEEQVNKLQAIIKKQSSELMEYKEQLEYLNDIISGMVQKVLFLVNTWREKSCQAVL